MLDTSDTRLSRLLLQAALDEPLPAGARVLELCAGGSSIGIPIARRRGAALTVAGISRRVLLTAQIDGARNRVRVRSRHAELLDQPAGERFDLILFGPEPSVLAGSDAMRPVLDDLCLRAAGHLTADGVLLLAHPGRWGAAETLEALVAGGLSAEVVAREETARAPSPGTEAILVFRGRLSP